MADPETTGLGNERVRLTTLLSVLALVVVVAAVRYLGGGGASGGVSSSSELEYEARNLPPLRTGSFVDQIERPVESAGNP